MSGREFGIALVGCGRIRRNRFEASAAIEGLTLTAVRDTVEERAPRFPNGGQMLAESPWVLLASRTL